MPRTRGAFALVGIAGCFAAAAYAATPQVLERPASDRERDGTGGSLPKPSITQHPDKLATSASAKFGFRVRSGKLRFQCRLDGRDWTACQAPVLFNKLAVGSHSFSVRVTARGRRGKPARFSWRVLQPKDFSIEPRLSGLGPLYPGAPPQPLPLVLSNPNPVPIIVTGLIARTTADPAGCASAQNLALSASSASKTSPIRVPANRSVSLPGPEGSPPAIRLRDLPVSQDACQRAQFPLAFSGTAKG
jgi:hypothetical protein